MGDLNTEFHWHCLTAEGWTTEVPGSKGKYTVAWSQQHKRRFEFQYDWSCTCMAYKTKPGYCKHIQSVIDQKLRCGWMQFTEGGDAGQSPDGSPCCPRCNGPVTAMGWGV